MTAYMWGEDLDPESGLPHVFLAGANLNMLSYMIKHHPQLDDRYKPETSLSKDTKDFAEEIQKNYENQFKFLEQDLEYKNLHTGSSFEEFMKEQDEKDCVCGEINARNCPVHQQNEPNYEQNIQEFEKFFGLDRNRFLDFSNDKGVKK